MEVHDLVIFTSPLNTLDKICYFNSKELMYQYFDSMPNRLSSSHKYNTTLVKTELVIGFNYNDVLLCNSGYLSLNNGNRLFFRITDIVSYQNHNTTTINILFDYLQSMAYGTNLIDNIPFGNIIRRQYSVTQLNNNDIAENIRQQLDFIHYGKKSIVFNQSIVFNELYCLIRSSVNLDNPETFGTEKSPKMKSSTGGTYDNISSPVNLYLLTQGELNNFMKDNVDYPWITQNITSVVLLPKEMFDINDWEKCRDGQGYELLKYKQGTVANNYDLFRTPITTLYSSLKLKKHLFGQDNGSIILNTYSGQRLELELNKINVTETDELVLRNNLSSGYYNEAIIYPVLYNSLNENTNDRFPRGEFADNAIILNTFDSVPVQINTQEAEYIKQAYQRRSQRFGTLDGAYESLTDPSQSTAEKAVNAGNTAYQSIKGIASIGGLFGSIANSVENTVTYKYEQLNNQRTRDLEPQSISEQTHNNSGAIANGRFGIIIKYYGYTENEIKSMERYYNKYGYLVNLFGNFPNLKNRPVDYVQFKTDNIINNVPNTHQEFVREQLSKGILIANNPTNNNPFNIEYLDNN